MPLLTGDRRALAFLVRSPNGRTETFMLLHGCTRQQLNHLIRSNLVTASKEHVGRARQIEVTRIKITNAGRAAFAPDIPDRSCSSDGPPKVARERGAAKKPQCGAAVSRGLTRASSRRGTLLPSKGILAIAAVTDIALNAPNGPVPGKVLAKHLRLPRRHLDPELKALLREGILIAARGRNGGYALARESRRITAEDILRVARNADDESEQPVSGSALLVRVVGLALAQAKSESSKALSRTSIEDLVDRLQPCGKV
jgi:Rrf2 family protein